MAIEVDISGLGQTVVDELCRGRHLREVVAMTALKRGTAQLNASPIGEHKAMEGMGRIKLSVPPLAYHYWGQRLGYECWADKQFQNEFLRDNPGVRVKQAGGTKPQILCGFEGNKRFKQTYK